MSAFERAAPDVVRPFAPQGQRAARVGVPFLQPAVCAPQHQDRAADSPPDFAVRRIVVAVDGGGGAILLADGVDAGGIDQRADIGGADLGREDGGRRVPLGQGVVDHRLGRTGQQPFRQRSRLGQQRPWPER